MVELVAVGQQQAVHARALEPDRFEHRLALGGAAQPVELGEEVAQDADGLALPVMGQEGAGEAFEVGDADTSAAMSAPTASISSSPGRSPPTTIARARSASSQVAQMLRCGFRSL